MRFLIDWGEKEGSASKQVSWDMLYTLYVCAHINKIYEQSQEDNFKQL